MSRPWAYESYYWSAQVFSIALGYGVIWEIYTQVLADYPGVARLARSVLLTILVMLFSRVLAQALIGQVGSPAAVAGILERDLRTVQGLLLLTLVVLAAYYAIPVGRNLKGMIVGYGLFVSVSIASLALGAALGRIFESWWQHLQPASYDGALLIWCVALWSYQPNPRPEVERRIEHDYDILPVKRPEPLRGFAATFSGRGNHELVGSIPWCSSCPSSSTPAVATAARVEYADQDLTSVREGLAVSIWGGLATWWRESLLRGS
jgi:hypothetical protein